MFKHLFRLCYTRKGMEALGFYLCYGLILLFLELLLVLAAQSFLMPAADGYAAAAQVMPGALLLSSTYCLLLSLAILREKKLLSDQPLLIIALGSGAIAFIASPFFGLIAAAYLTTQKR